MTPDGSAVYATGFTDSAVAAFRVVRCGDGFRDADEECDDGNAIDGDCCSAACQVKAVDGTPCDDDLFCVVDETCQAGTCRGTPRDARAGFDSYIFTQ